MRYWKRIKNDVVTTVENYSHDSPIDGAIEVTKEEFDILVVLLAKPKINIDWKDRWSKAKDITEKLDVIAEKLSLK